MFKKVKKMNSPCWISILWTTSVFWIICFSIQFHLLHSESIKNGPLVNSFSVVKVYRFKLSRANFFSSPNIKTLSPPAVGLVACDRTTRQRSPHLTVVGRQPNCLRPHVCVSITLQSQHGIANHCCWSCHFSNENCSPQIHWHWNHSSGNAS